MQPTVVAHSLHLLQQPWQYLPSTSASFIQHHLQQRLQLNHCHPTPSASTCVEQKRNMASTSASSASSAIYNIVEQKRKLQVWELKTTAYIYMYIQCVHIYLEINGYSYIIWALRQSASGTETICLRNDLFSKGPHIYIRHRAFRHQCVCWSFAVLPSFCSTVILFICLSLCPPVHLSNCLSLCSSVHLLNCLQAFLLGWRR